eukprot:CAMPEP_0119371136 /NCGR_PEP_ID=MMETSP1334-20130426/17382_1 /TAXON_ID=127549 /ORGANISM="Calcidiscus leptoporus, Strain RCC1130" /LENGTH=115 /DNA_ID=CAMNT_0007388349 /DNA_START=596 /DNA_END=941 /DNA_ORIENTATION=+
MGVHSVSPEAGGSKRNGSDVGREGTAGAAAHPRTPSPGKSPTRADDAVHQAGKGWQLLVPHGVVQVARGRVEGEVHRQLLSGSVRRARSNEVRVDQWGASCARRLRSLAALAALA